MKKLTALFMFIIGITSLLSGCSSNKLADDFDKDTVEKSAKQVIEYMNAKDYESVVNMFSTELQKQLTADTLKENADKYYDAAGVFEKYKNVAIIGQKLKSTKEDTAIAIIVAKYKNQNITYTVSFDTNMKVIGLYMK